MSLYFLLPKAQQSGSTSLENWILLNIDILICIYDIAIGQKLPATCIFFLHINVRKIKLVKMKVIELSKFCRFSFAVSSHETESYNRFFLIKYADFITVQNTLLYFYICRLSQYLKFTAQLCVIFTYLKGELKNILLHESRRTL